MALKKRLVRKPHAPEITLVPLIDTFSVLLLIFMVATPMVQNNIKVDLPQGKSKETGASQDFVVTLSKDNKLYFNSFPVAENALVATVKKELAQQEECPVFVRADEAVCYGKVIDIVEKLKQSGVRYVAMATRST